MSTLATSAPPAATLTPPQVRRLGPKPLSEATLRHQERITAAFRLLRETATLSPSNSSNISERVGDGRFAIAGPEIAPDQTVGPSAAALVDGAGGHHEGRIGPGIAEVIAVHAAVYRLRPDVGAVVHTHSPNLTSLAIAHRDLPIRYAPLLEWNVIPVIPVTAWAPRYAPGPVEEALAEDPAAAGVLLGNRGTLIFGRDALDAARHVVLLEEAAGILIDAEILGGARPLPTLVFAAN